jgi:hypothetical protein
MFGCFLCSRSFNNLEGPLAWKQPFLPITFDDIGLILIATITPNNLRNWALIILIITIKFMVDQYPFLFEALAQVNNNIFFFQ